MTLRWVLAAFLFCTSLANAQVEGRFYLEKETYAPGDPVFLYFEVTSRGSEIEINHADPYAFCSGYDIRVSSDFGPKSSCGARGFAGSCLSSFKVLKAGEKYTERILLNYEHKINAEGYYSVDAKRTVSYAGASEYYSSAAKSVVEIKEQLHFRVDTNAALDQASLNLLAEQLRASDPNKRREAALSLASLAPPTMENTLVALASNPDEQLRQFAPLGLHRLNTPRSMVAMAELLKKTEPGSYVHMKSAEFLAESGSPEWFPLLLGIAEQKPKIGNYVWDAAESGGEQSFPLLLKLLRSGDTEFEVPIGVSGFGYSGVRAAVPILIDLLRNKDISTASRALAGLRDLTHVSIEGDHWAESPQSQYPKWVRWWSENGGSARIYKAWECSEFTVLQ